MGSSRAGRVAIFSAGGQAGCHSSLRARLCAEGFLPETLADLDNAVDWSTDGDSDALLLIWDLPRSARAGRVSADAVAAVRGLRCRGFTAAVLVIGSVTTPSYAAAVLDNGADEYIRIPYDPLEVAARLRALMRRSCGLIWLGAEPEGPVLDRWRHIVSDGEAEVALTPREAALLECLAHRAGRPVAREELAACVWGAESLERAPTNIVDVYVAYVRRKLGTLGCATLIRSVRGIGYELASGRRSPSRAAAEQDLAAP